MSSPGSLGTFSAMPGVSVVHQGKILLSSHTCRMDATSWLLREWTGRGCWCPRPPARPSVGILGSRFPDFLGKTGGGRLHAAPRAGAGQEQPPRAQPHRASRFPPVWSTQEQSHTHGSCVASPGSGPMMSWGPPGLGQHKEHPARHAESGQANSRRQPPTQEGRTGCRRGTCHRITEVEKDP